MGSLIYSKKIINALYNIDLSRKFSAANLTNLNPRAMDNKVLSILNYLDFQIACGFKLLIFL